MFRVALLQSPVCKWESIQTIKQNIIWIIRWLKMNIQILTTVMVAMCYRVQTSKKILLIMTYTVLVFGLKQFKETWKHFEFFRIIARIKNCLKTILWEQKLSCLNKDVEPKRKLVERLEIFRNNKLIWEIHSLFFLSFLFKHQGIVVTDILKCYIVFH